MRPGSRQCYPVRPNVVVELQRDCCSLSDAMMIIYAEVRQALIIAFRPVLAGRLDARSDYYEHAGRRAPAPPPTRRPVRRRRSKRVCQIDGQNEARNEGNEARNEGNAGGDE